MAHFAKINKENIVEQVIVADQEFIDSGAVGDPTKWIQTSYNTYGGVHKTGGESLRKNFAGVGDTYDEKRDAFIPPQPYPSWVLNEDTCQWEAPTPRPDDFSPANNIFYDWSEEDKKWVKIQY